MWVLVTMEICLRLAIFFCMCANVAVYDVICSMILQSVYF